jgi:hypothetical protein
VPNQSKFRLSRIYCSVCRIWLTAFTLDTEVEFYGYFRNQQNENDVVSDHIRSSVIFAVLNINCQLKKFVFLVWMSEQSERGLYW